jgi:glutamate-5-semialdehyde dehydrogenase
VEATKINGPLSEALRAVRRAGRSLARSTSAQREHLLECVARRLENSRDKVLAANAEDMTRATTLSDAMRDRLLLTEARFDSMVSSVRALRLLPDPLGEERVLGVRPNGLVVSRRRIPLGVLAVIYEARPNVTVEAAAIALRTGNAVVLRGGSEAVASNTCLASLMREGIEDAGLPGDAMLFVADTARERVAELLGAVGYIDLVIPRGGPALMAFVDEYARVPVIRHGARDRGVCHGFGHCSERKGKSSRGLQRNRNVACRCLHCTVTVHASGAAACRFGC